MNNNRGKIPLRRGLAMRQLLITLGFALLVGLVTGGIELVNDWHALRGRIDATTRQNLELVRASAAEAAFQLNGEQADNVAAGLPNIEIYGTEGTLVVPNPNSFTGEVKLRKGREKDLITIPLSHGYNDNFRGLGVADMAQAIRSNRPHRANGEVTYHVLDAMQSFLDAGAKGRAVDVKSACERPAALPVGLKDGAVDA